jgi:glutaredoxin
MLQRILSWWRKRHRPRAEHLELVLYTRQGCHLCEDAQALLQEEQRKWGFSIRSIDIDSDPDLVRRFAECVPVVQLDGKVRFRGRINRVLLARLLTAQARLASRFE